MPATRRQPRSLIGCAGCGAYLSWLAWCWRQVPRRWPSVRRARKCDRRGAPRIHSAISMRWSIVWCDGHLRDSVALVRAGRGSGRGNHLERSALSSLATLGMTLACARDDSTAHSDSAQAIPRKAMCSAPDSHSSDVVLRRMHHRREATISRIATSRTRVPTRRAATSSARRRRNNPSFQGKEQSHQGDGRGNRASSTTAARSDADGARPRTVAAIASARARQSMVRRLKADRSEQSREGIERQFGEVGKVSMSMSS